MNDQPAVDWYSDDPIAHAEGDALDRERFVDGLEAVLDTVQHQASSSVLALIGPWGSGKSSVLKTIEERLDTQEASGKQWVTVSFNPWYFQDLASLQAGFFRDLQSALPSHSSWDKAREGIAGLAKSVAPFGSLLSLLGVDASKALTGFAELVEGDAGAARQHRIAEAALRKADRPVLVVVDDVDRLDPPELLLLFKLIRLVGRLPNVHYLLAYDEDTLIDALGRTGLVGTADPRRPIDYLEKIVQVRLDMPPVRDEQLTAWVERSLAQLGANHGLEMTDEMSQRFSKAYFAHIRERLHTPRGVKRYFAQVDAFLAGVREEVELVDFLIVSWIRSAEPLLYRALVANRDRLLGQTSHGGLEWPQKRVPGEAKGHWVKVLDAARVAPGHCEGVAAVLGQLFPRFAHDWSDSNQEFSGRRSSSGRVSNPHYFDRYFAFAVPAEDLPDHLVHAACRQITTKTPGPELRLVEEKYASHTELILTKFEDWVEPGSDGNLEIVAWLIRNITRLPSHMSIADSYQRARWVGGRLYCQLAEAQRFRVFTEAVTSIQELDYFSSLSNALAAKHQSHGLTNDRGERIDRADHAFASRIAELLNNRISQGPLGIDDGYWRLVWDWMRIDINASRKWAKLGLEKHAWPPLDLAARFVSTLYALGVPNPPIRLGEFDADSLQKLVNIRSLASAIGISADDANLLVERDMLATEDNRRLAARKGLAQMLAADESAAT